MSKKRKKNKHDRDPVDPKEGETAAPMESSAALEAVEDAPAPPGNAAEELRQEAAAMRELAQRKQAEFENYRKRVERERADLVRYASFEIVKEVLPVLDNLERAIQASDSSPEEQFRAGVEIIRRQFQEILTRQGLAEVESLGKPFDPHVHEAVSRVESDDHPDGTVVEVFQKGYLFKDRLLRPAMVSVSRSSEGSDDEPDDRETDEGEVVRKTE